MVDQKRDWSRRGFLKTAGLAAVAKLNEIYGDESKNRIEYVDKELDHPWENGLYSTLAGLALGPDSNLPGSEWANSRLGRIGGKPAKKVEKCKIKVNGTDGDFNLSYVDCGKSAPLVVVVPGLRGGSEELDSMVWMKWLSEMGYGSVSYDSTFSPRMVSKGKYGVPGNLEKEAEFAGRIISEFMNSRNLKPEKIGAVGRSYGAVQSIWLDILSQQNKIGFKIDRVLAYTPPISMDETMKLLDDKFRRAMETKDELERTKGQSAADQYNIINMYLEFVKYNKPEYPMPKKFNVEKADLCLGRFFNYALGDTLEAAITAFPEVERSIIINGKSLREAMRESGDEKSVRRDYANGMSYGQFYEMMVGPYWSNKSYSKEMILNNGEIYSLMGKVGDWVNLILTRNDPINREGAASVFENINSKGKFSILKRGGHCGFCLSKWAQLRMKQIFD